VKVRAPSFVNLQSLPKLAVGRLIADVVACIGTTDIVLGEWTADAATSALEEKFHTTAGTYPIKRRR